MSRHLAVVALVLTGCVTYEPYTGLDQPVVRPLPTPSPTNAKYVRELERFKAEVAESKRPDIDKSANTMLMCDRLFPGRGSDGHRLCMLRGMDRYVDHMTPPISERAISVEVPQPAPHVHPLVPYSPPCQSPCGSSNER